MLTKNGYSLIMWTVTFATIMAALMFIQVPLKREIQTKVRQTADYAFWSLWGDSPQRFAREKNSKEKNTVSQQQREELLTLHSGVSKVYRRTSSEERGSSAAVDNDRGSQALLKIFDLNQ